VCETNDDCASAVCNVGAGTCTAAANVVYASPTGAGVCSQSDPCSITQAFSVANAVRNTVKLEPGSYIATVLVTGKTVIVEGTGATVTESGTNDTLTVKDNAQLQIHGLTIVNDVAVSGGKVGAACRTTNGTLRPVLKLTGVTVDATAQAVLADGCDATISQSLLHDRAAVGGTEVLFASGASNVVADRTTFDGGDGIAAIAAFVHITNSVVSNQAGPDGGAFGGGAGSVTISFSTIVNSAVKCATSGPAACTGASQNGVCFDNSIILNTATGAPANTVTGVACSFAFTEVFPQSAVLPNAGAGNKVGIDPQVVDPTNGNFHLKSTSPAIDAANPTATDVIDFDGTMRPHGLHDDLGAFEFH
jgi:hypothetical protein